MKQVNSDIFYFQLSVHALTQKSLLLNKRQIDYFQLIPGQKLTIQAGFSKLVVQVKECSDNSSFTTFYLSEAAYSGLTHYHGEPLWLVFQSPFKLILGPTLAITVSSPTWRKIDKIYAIKKRALLALEKGILFYCFHLSKVDLENNLVEAYYFHPGNGKWVRQFLPFPQVLYHRSSFPFTYYAKQANANNIYHKLWANSAIQKINSAYLFDKWTVYQALTRHQEISRVQPETALLNRLALKQFLNRYKFCYVKNIYGRGGKQVIRIEKADFCYLCKAGGSNTKLWKFKQLNNLYLFLQEKLGENLIIQEGILLGRLNNRPFDIRVLVQKNINAEWVITALSFRVAAYNAVVTNIAAGAKEIVVAPADNVLGSGLNIKSLNDFILKILSALEAYYGDLGEVGLDVGLDIYGKLWLFEANSQPSSRGYKEAASEELCDRIFGLPLDYAKYLARGMFKKLEGDMG